MGSDKNNSLLQIEKWISVGSNVLVSFVTGIANNAATVLFCWFILQSSIMIIEKITPLLASMSSRNAIILPSRILAYC